MELCPIRPDRQTTPLPARFDTDPLVIDLEVARVQLERGLTLLRGIRDGDFLSPSYEVRLARTDIESANARVASALQRRRSEL